MKDIDTHDSHYLHEKYRIFPNGKLEPWTDYDADYNIRSGLTFRETEERTIEAQGWRQES